MPIVEVKLWEGRDERTKAKIIKGIKDVLTSLKIPASAVTVIITEYSKKNWGQGGDPSV